MLVYNKKTTTTTHKQGIGQTVNGEIDAAVDYAAKTHELQTIIEKQVFCIQINPLSVFVNFHFQSSYAAFVLF